LPPLRVVVPVPADWLRLPVVLTLPLKVALWALAMLRLDRAVVPPTAPVMEMSPGLPAVPLLSRLRLLAPSIVLKDRLPPLLVTLEAASRTSGLLAVTLPPPLRLVPRKVLAAAGGELGSVARLSVPPALVLPSMRM